MKRSIKKNRSCGCSEATEFDAELAFTRLAQQHTKIADALTLHLRGDSRRRGLTEPLSPEAIDRILRITGGVETEPSEYPECCLIGRVNDNGTQEWFCTGVLVHPRIVLTAGHCCDPGSKPKFVALDATDEDHLNAAEIAKVKKVLVHRDYTNSGTHDIAVLVLRSPASTTPVRPSSSSEIAAARKTTLVGFGNNDLASTRGFGIQRKVTVDISSVRRSATDDLDADESRFGHESDYEMVAGGDGFDSCNGDSGGPAYLESANGRTVAGLTSRGVRGTQDPCGDGGIYTRVDVHIEFIRTVMEANGIDPAGL